MRRTFCIMQSCHILHHAVLSLHHEKNNIIRGYLLKHLYTAVLCFSPAAMPSNNTFYFQWKLVQYVVQAMKTKITWHLTEHFWVSYVFCLWTSMVSLESLSAYMRFLYEIALCLCRLLLGTLFRREKACCSLNSACYSLLKLIHKTLNSACYYSDLFIRLK
jgi:hypothetical protein